MVRAHFCSLPQRRSAAVYLFSAVQFSCPNAPRLPPPVHDLPSQDIRPNGCCSPHGVSAALVTSLRLQCRPQRVLPLFLQNCRLTVSGHAYEPRTSDFTRYVYFDGSALQIYTPEQADTAS